MEANSPRKGAKVWGKGKSKGTGMRASFALLHLTSTSPFAHWVNTVLSVVRSFSNLPSPLFLFFFLSFPFMRPTILQLRFDSVSGHPRDPFFLLRFTAHFQPTFKRVYRACSLPESCRFSVELFNFLVFILFFFTENRMNMQIFSSFGESRSLSCT